MATIQNIVIPSKNTPNVTPLKVDLTAGSWIIQPSDPKVQLIVAFSENQDAPSIAQTSRRVELSLDQATSVYLTADIPDGKTALAGYSDSLFLAGGGGRGGGVAPTYTFDTPLIENGGAVSLKLTQDGGLKLGNDGGLEIDTSLKAIADGGNALKFIQEVYDNTLKDSGLSPITITGNKQQDRGFTFEIMYDPSSGLETKTIGGKQTLSLDPNKNAILKNAIEKADSNEKAITKLQNSQQTITASNPLAITKGNITLNIGEGLKLDGNNLAIDGAGTIIGDVKNKAEQALNQANTNKTEIENLKQADTKLEGKITENTNLITQTKNDLQSKIDSLNNVIEFIGVIPKTEKEVTADSRLLSNFVQEKTQRPPRNGDFIKTSDGAGFIYNATSWVNFGKIEITIATTAKAGIVKLGNADGELTDKGNGLVEVKGFSTLSGNVGTNSQNITKLTEKVTNLESKNKNFVTTNTEQTITAKKSFNVLPEATMRPTENAQLANKEYVDIKVANSQVWLNFNAPLKNQDGTISLDLKENGGLIKEANKLALDINSNVFRDAVSALIEEGLKFGDGLEFDKSTKTLSLKYNPSNFTMVNGRLTLRKAEFSPATREELMELIKKKTPLAKIDVSNVTDFSRIFFYDQDAYTDYSGLKFWDVSNGTTFGSMFFNCTNLTSLDLSNWDVSNGTDFYGMLYNCANLTTIGNCSAWRTDKATNWGNFCTGTKIPESEIPPKFRMPHN